MGEVLMLRFPPCWDFGCSCHFPISQLCFVALTARGCRGGVVLAKRSRAPSSSQAVPMGHSPVMPRAISGVSISFVLALTSLWTCF